MQVQNVRFLELRLLSQTEKRGLRVPLSSPKVLIQGGNGFGKSAIIKTLFETFGAAPQKIDERWKNANVSSALTFESNNERYTVVRSLGLHALLDKDGELLFAGRGIVREWGPALADFLRFRLTMSESSGKVVVPPPSYIFAPSYIDQDTGWSRPWISFKDFYLPESSKTLADYHSGLKPDAYYEAKTSLVLDRNKLSEIEVGASALREAIEQIKRIGDEGAPTYDLQEFEAEVRDLVAESDELLRSQSEYRRAISDLHQEAHILHAESRLLERALQEVRTDFDLAVRLPDEVECPTCGTAYVNDLAERFALIADEGVLAEALGVVRAKIANIGEREKAERERLGGIEAALHRIDQVLSAQRATIKLGDVVMSAGKTEAARMLRDTLAKKVLEADDIKIRIDALKAEMASLTSAKRSAKILRYYRERLADFADYLDVKLDGTKPQSITTIKAARGSEGPRGLLAYYYAFLHTKAQFTTGPSFPIVVDAPNQQGQDTVHLPQMLNFLFNHAPIGNQVIVATEDVPAGLPEDVDVRSYGERKRQVLRDDQFEVVSTFFKPIQAQLLAWEDAQNEQGSSAA